MEIKQCTRNEYQAFLDMVNEAFGHEASSEWFQQNIGNCTPYPDFATDEEIGRHIIAIIDGKVVGAVGAYPIDWIVSDACGNRAIVKAFGIGQVSCSGSYRNRGVMSALLQAAETAMREQGTTVGFLSGDRFRYGRFGYEFGGNSLRFSINKWRFGHQQPENLLIRQADTTDWPAINKAYETLPSYAVRDERTWERHLKSARFHWYVGEMEGKTAYMAYESPKEIEEIYGDPDVAAAMLGDLLSKHESTTVCYPMQNGTPDLMSAMLYQSASYIENKVLDLLAVIDAPKLLEALSPLQNGAACQGAGNGLNEESRLMLARRLIGYAYQPLSETLKGCESVTPLCVWMSRADAV